MSAWFIDALDGLSGQAFASFRETGELDTLTQLNDPAWFISAPDFAPEPISGRAISLAAAQRGFQLGLSMDAISEVAFASLDALVDYVQRLYLSGGGGDGPDGIDPGPGGPEGPEGPEDRDRSEERMGTPETMSPLQQGLLDFANELVSKSGSLTGDGTSAELSRLVPSKTFSVEPTDADPLFHAANLISNAFVNLERESAADVISVTQPPVARYQGFYAVLDLLGLTDWPDLPIAYKKRESLRYWRWGCAPDFIQSDIMDVLARLPVPKRVCESLSTIERWRSVKDLFFAVLGNPAYLTNTDRQMDRSALFLFAAAAMVQRTPHHRFVCPTMGS